MDYDSRKRLVTFLAYFYSPPTEWEEELIADAASETAVELYIGYESQCIFTNAPFSELTKLPHWLYVRAEELDSNDSVEL